MTSAYPLKWPTGWKRTISPKRSNFGTTTNMAVMTILRELRLLGAENVVISSNIPLRQDGLPRGVFTGLDDCGVAVYFTRNKKQQCFPCDKWNAVQDNLWAVAKTIGALRGIERWGAKETVDAAFTGFEALPNYSAQQDYFADAYRIDELDSKFREWAKKLHPDVGGSAEAFTEMKKQYDKKVAELGGNGDVR